MMHEEAAYNMIHHQAHTWNVVDHGVLQLMAQVARERYVALAYQGVAYSEGAIVASNGVAMPPAREVGLMLETCAIKHTDSVMVVGPESGYLLDLIARQSHHVSWVVSAAISNNTPLSAQVNCIDKSATSGWQQEGPFDVVIVVGAMPSLPQDFLQALNVDGRLFVVLGESTKLMTAWCITRTEKEHWQHKSMYEVVWPWLPEACPEEKFVL
jgi:protein-L-isoaspartate(D-aspartate) O-methyltransferase